MTEFAAQRAEVNAVPAAVKRPRLYMPLILRLGGTRWLTPIRLFLIVGSVTCLTSWALKMPLATAVNTSYGIAIINYLARRQQKLLLRLRPSITLDDAHFRYEWYALLRFRRTIIIGLSLLAPIALVLVNWHSPVLRQILSGKPFPPAYGWGLFLAMVNWILIIQTLVVITCNSLRFYRLGHHHTRVDLFDTSVLAPFALAGITVLVVFAGSYTIIPIAAVASRTLLEGALRSVVVGLPVAIAGTVLPILGIHRNLRVTKATEISHVSRAIGGDRAALAATRLASESASVPVSNLVIYRQTLSGISEWPLNSLAAVRIVIVVAVPIGAWIAGALVDRLINRLVG